MTSLLESYDLLECKPSATTNEIKTAYKKMTLKFHPDKNPHVSNEIKETNTLIFHKITEAKDNILKHLENRNHRGTEHFKDPKNDYDEEQFQQIANEVVIKLTKMSDKLEELIRKMEENERQREAAITNLFNRITKIEANFCCCNNIKK